MPRYSSSYSRYSSASPATTGIRESAITWSSSGGHNHDGDNASLIDFERYTVFDFGLNPIFTTNNRSLIQDRNIVSFENYVIDIISRNTITPESIIINNDTFINGENISVRTITTNQLATDAVQSLNFDYSSGLYSNAGSFFNLADGVIRTPSMFLNSSGDLYLSNSVTIGAATASDIVDGAAAGANAIPTGGAANDVNTGNTTVTGTKITANSITTTQIATNAIRSTNYVAPGSGEVFSNTGSFLNLSGGDFISKGFSAYANGSVYISSTATIGSTTASTVVSGAAAGATSVQIGGAASDVNSGNTNISGGKIRTGDIESTGFVRGTGTYSTTGARFDLDSGDIITPKFRLHSNGVIYATDVNLTGTINATGGYIGDSSYGFDIANYGTFSELSSKDNTGSGSSRGKVVVRSYGDVNIYSTPTEGAHVNQTYRTELAGEWLKIWRTDSTNKPYLELGNFNGDADTMGLRFSLTDSNFRAQLEMLDGYGLLRLYNTSGSEKIWLSGQNGDARFYRDVTVDDDLSVGDDCTIGGNLYVSLNDTNAIRTRVNTSGGLGVIRTGAGSADYTPITIDTQNGGLWNGSFYARYMISFYDYGTNRGTIFHNGTNTTYGTSSDYRLKENIRTITDGLDIVKKIKPRYYTFIDNEEAGLQIGFIAHELQEVVPQAAFGIKDAVDEEGKPILQQIEKSAIVPHLVSAIQELSAELEILKAQVASFSN